MKELISLCIIHLLVTGIAPPKQQPLIALKYVDNDNSMTLLAGTGIYYSWLSYTFEFGFQTVSLFIMGEENFNVSVAPPSLSLSGLMDANLSMRVVPGTAIIIPFAFFLRTSAYILNIQWGITAALMLLERCMYIYI